MKNIGKMMKQAQEMQTRMSEMQAELEKVELTGVAGGGLVSLRLNGKFKMSNLTIDPSILTGDDVEMVEDLIVAAFNDAKAKVDEYSQAEMAKITGGMALPDGFKMPF